MPKRILAVLAVLLLGLATVSPAYADTHTSETTTPTFTFVALPLPTPTYGTGELTIQRTSAPDATSYQFTATIMGNGVFVGTNNSRTAVLNTDPQHGGTSTQYVICVPETVMINVADSTGTVVASVPAGANQAGSKDLRSCPEGPSGPPDADGDKVPDDGTDKCLGTPAGTVVDASGCAVVVLPPDADGDKVPDDGTDKCLGTPAGTVVDASGCAVVVLPPDADGDKVPDDGTDKCVDKAGPASNGGCPVVDNDQVCEPLNSGKIDTTGDPLTVVLAAPEGMVITGYCVKAGSATQDEGPEYPALTSDQLNQNSITVTHSSGKAISHYSFSWGPAPVVAACPPGMGWKDFNDNGKVDEGECVKRVPPGSGPPVVVPPVVVSPVVPPVVVPPVVTPPVVVPPVVVPPAVPPVVVVPIESTPVVSEGDPTNGRGFRVETAVTDVSAVPSGQNSTYLLGGGLAGLTVLMLVTAAARRARLASSK